MPHNATTILSGATRIITIVATAAAVVACGARTSVSGDWAEGATRREPFSHVLVVGVSPNSRVRRSFEVALAEKLATRGGKATAAVQTAESRPQLTPDVIAAMVKSTGADAVAVTRVASRKVAPQETKTRTGVKTQHPANLNGGAGLVELFSLEYNEYEEPGELRAEATAVVETSVYEAAGAGRLVYSLTTTSAYREERDDVIGDVAAAIAAKLRREGLVR